RLDAFLRCGQILDLKAEMVGADKGRVLPPIRRRASFLAFVVEECEIDDAVAQVDRRADIEILATDAREFEYGFVERRGLVEVLDDDRKVAKTGHAILLQCGVPALTAIMSLPSIIGAQP